MAIVIKTKDDEKIKLDEFYKSLMFQKIMDSDFTRNERDMLLVIFRKTIHFDKWMDNLSKQWLGKTIGISEDTLRNTQNSLIEKCLIEFKQSKGGKTHSSNRFNSYGIGKYLINDIFNNWIKIKEESGIPIDYVYE